MDWDWIIATGTEFLMVLISGIGIYIVLLLLTRWMGLRSFSKMSSFDFAITVAFGSVIASTIISKKPSLLIGAFALAVLYAIQYIVSKGRRFSAAIEHFVDNEPLLLMVGAEILPKHLNTAKMTESDLKSKLRQAGITHPQQVFAAILETTGDVSILKMNDNIDLWLFEGIKGSEKLASFLSKKS